MAIPTPADRAAFLERACAGDTALLRRVEALLLVRESPLKSKTEPDAAITQASPSPDAPSGASAASAEEPTRQIGPYRLLEKLGEGGMGVVYLAEQQQPIRRRVALKVIKPGMDSALVIARFEAERQALAMMDHHHIARVFDAGTTDTGRPYFVMEAVQGVPITRYCDDNRLSLRDRLEIFIAACQAIQHAHQKGIIHRDVKPSNVLVTIHDGRPTPKVIDFGVAKAIEQRLTERTMYTQYGAVVGTPEYMSPEQAEMTPLGVDTRSDIYSLGVMLYELLTGTTPLERQRLRELGLGDLVRLVKEEDPPKPSTRLSSLETLAAVAAQRRVEPAALTRFVRGDLDWIVMKCLEKDRTRRYETASALARDLERFLRDEPVDARPPSAADRFGKFARKHKGPLAAAAVFVTLVLAGSAASVWQALRATLAEEAAREERDRALAAERRASDDRDKAQSAERREREARAQAEAAEHQAKADRDRALTAEERARRDRDLAVKAEANAQAAANQSQLEAATAKAVTDFLQHDLLARADASKEPNRDLKLREVLDRAANNIAGRFEKQPLVEAAIRETIGKAYHSLGIHDESADQFSAAFELRRRESGENDPFTLADKEELGLQFRELGRPADAERLYLEVLDAYRKSLGNEHEFTLNVLAKLGVAYSDQGEFVKSTRVYNEALEIARHALDRRNPILHEVIHNLGSLLLEWQRYAEAEPLVAESLDLHREVLGEEHPDTITSMNNLGLVYQGLGRLDEAEALLKRAWELRRRVQGDEHPLAITAMTNLALLRRVRGQLDDAEKLLAQALELRRRVQGEEHPLTITAMNNLALIYSDQRKLAEAERLYAQALQLSRRVQGNENPHTLVMLYGLAVNYQEQGRYGEAEPLLEELLASRRRHAGNRDPRLVFILRRLVLGRIKLDGYGGAEPLLREYWEAAKKELPEGWQQFEAESTLGASLAAQKKYADAEPLLLSAYEGLRSYAEKNPSADKVQLRLATQRLAELYDAWENKEQAAAWQKRLGALQVELEAKPDNGL
ncbi:MAG TPA: serine/threonine-protein kinase [Pirellulales bacterium]|nr:serine/threonine-protein kinase [Pirellulales bacterium]